MTESSTENLSESQSVESLQNGNSAIELAKIEFDTEKIYKYDDKLKFKITLTTNEDIDDDVEVNVLYFGPNSDSAYDQNLCNAVVGPFVRGEHFFEVETEEAIPLHNLPINGIFGLTTVLVSLTYKGIEFIRVGYIVNVQYPGIKDTELQGDEDGEEEIKSDEESDEEELKSDEDIDLIEDEEILEEDKKEDLEEEVEEEEIVEEEKEEDLEEEIPVETPIKKDLDDFEYRGHKMSKSKIVFSFMKKPIIQCFEVPKQNEEVKKVKTEK